ncbi:hypothetical protein SVIOM74S_06806 [Streptomyces violarus]
MGPWPQPWAHSSPSGALGVSMPALHLRGRREWAAPVLAGGDARTAPIGSVVAQLSVRGKETSTRRFFLRPASVELSAIGYCSP